MKSVLTILALTQAVAHDFKSCPGAKGDLHVTAVTLTPDPPKLGANLQLNFNGGPVTTDITSGKAHLAIKLHSVELASIDFDICTQLGITCPIKSGSNIAAKATYKIPDVPLPPGLTITVETTFEDGTGAALDCYTLDTKISSSADATSQLALPGIFKGSLPDAAARHLFSLWRAQYPFVNLDDDEEARFHIWKTNFETIIDHNMKSQDDYQMGMNEFGHLTWREFKKQYVGTGIRSDLLTSSIERKQHVVPSNFTASAAGVDWSKKGAVTAIKNQGQCGSCVRFF